MRFRQIALLHRFNSPSVVLLNITALANPFRAQRRKSLLHITVKIRIAPWAACVVHAHRLVYFDFSIHGFSRSECYLAKRHTNCAMNFTANVNLARFRKVVAAAVDRGFCGFVWAGVNAPGYSSAVILLIHEKPCVKTRMAENPSPAPDPRSLRRHYPHQVQGVSSLSPDSQPLRLPRIVELRIKPDPAKSTEHMVRASARTGRIRECDAGSQTV